MDNKYTKNKSNKNISQISKDYHTMIKNMDVPLIKMKKVTKKKFLYMQ